MKKTLLSVSHLCFERSGRLLLDGINFSVQPGELIGVIGPNGAGKSTLLKTLVHFLPASSGNVLLGSQSVATLPHLDRARQVSYLAQHPNTSFAFTVRETIALGAHHQGQIYSSGKQLQQQVDAIAYRLCIVHLLERKLDELSGGETQLVHFARILMQNAPLMLLDEPTASLDIGHEAQLMNDLRRQCREGSAALVAIHNLNIAAAFCDRLILLDGGKLIADGRPEEVITQASMSQLYQQQVMVSKHPISGSVTVLPRPEISHKRDLHVHLIGGAGSAVALTRSLMQLGVTVTGGVSHEQDSDAEFWAISGIEYVSVPAFSGIDDTALRAASELQKRADVTIFCHFPIGPMNEANLTLAAQAETLWLLADNLADEPGRFYSAQQEKNYNRLTENAQAMTTLKAIKQLQKRINE